jgi:hypothetical protein
MKLTFLILLSLITLFGCNKAKDKASESVTNTIIEKTFKQAGVATENIKRANKNSADIAIEYDGENLFADDVFTTIVNVTERMIVFSFNSKDEKITISFSGLKDMLDSKPIIGKYMPGKADPKDANGTVVAITMAKDNGFAYTLAEGEATILKINQDEVIIDFSGKAATFLAANSPENWKPIQGKIVSKYPAANFIKVKKEDLFY